MTIYLSNRKYAKLLGTSHQSVAYGISTGVVYKTVKGIDPEHPINCEYAKRFVKNKKTNAKKSKAKKKEAFKKKNLDPVELAELASSAKWDIDDRQKLEATRLKSIQADKAALEFAERLNIMMDDKTLRRKFGIFYDHILNDLIYLPDSISDILANEARSADTIVEAVNVVTKLLKRSLKSVIKKGKRAAKQVRPPKKGRKYVIKKADK
jgi:hypothetical protein